MSVTDYSSMAWPAGPGQFCVPFIGVEHFFEELGGGRVRLFEAVDIETNECIPVDTVKVPEEVEDTLRGWGYELVEDAESMAEAM